MVEVKINFLQHISVTNDVIPTTNLYVMYMIYTRVLKMCDMHQQ